jgi:hypothetical protein
VISHGQDDTKEREKVRLDKVLRKRHHQATPEW